VFLEAFPRVGEEKRGEKIHTARDATEFVGSLEEKDFSLINCSLVV
jgi:hypothetical protein